LAAEQFLEGLTPIMALQALMFERVGGLNLQQIGLLFSVWWLAYLVAELPSGILADYWSRKKVIMLGAAARTAGFIVWFVWPSFMGYAVGFALWGVAIAFSSGAVAAFLHNELRAVGKDSMFAKYFGSIMAAYYAGILLSLGVAATLTLQHTNVLIGISAAASCAIILLLAPVAEAAYNRRATYLKTLQAGVAELRQSGLLRYVCVGLLVIYMIISVLEELLPRLYAAIGLNEHQIPVMAAIALVATILVVSRLEVMVRFSLAKQMLAMAGGLVLLVAGLYFGGAIAVLGILLFNLVFQLFRPLFQHHVINASTGDAKATIGSLPGIGSGLLGAGAYGIIGAVAQEHGEPFAIGAYGVFWILVLLGLALWGMAYPIRPLLKKS
jgi:MFS family permease